MIVFVDRIGRLTTTYVVSATPLEDSATAVVSVFDPL